MRLMASISGSYWPIPTCCSTSSRIPPGSYRNSSPSIAGVTGLGKLDSDENHKENMKLSDFSGHLASSNRGSNRSEEAGFTLLESLTVLVMIGVLSAVVAPFWLVFWTNRQITLARDELRLGIQTAQAASVRQKSSWRFSLRQVGDRWEWAVHPNTQSWEAVAGWEPLDGNVDLEPADTTLARKDGVYYVRFNFRGEVVYRLSTVTVKHKQDLGRQRCVVVSTLLGATRYGEEHAYPNGNDRHCY